MLDTFLPVVKEILVSSVSTSPPRMLLLLLLDNSLSLLFVDRDYHARFFILVYLFPFFGL